MKFYFVKISVRNALRNGTLTFARLFGLSISFAVILFAAGYVFYETSFDKSIPDHDRIYRCLMEGKLNNQDVSFAVTSPEMANVLPLGIPEITSAVRIFSSGETTLQYNKESVFRGHLLYADPEFFSLFSIPVKSNQDDPLASTDNLVIANSVADSHFGSAEQALNKVVQIRGEDYTITGVFDDPPSNFHLQPKLFMSLKKINPDSVGWGSQSYYTYFKTERPANNIDELSFKITKLVYTHSGEDIDGAAAKTWEDLKFAPGAYLFYNAEPLTKIHFSRHNFDPAVTSNKYYVYGAMVLALLILLISSINFVNLTIANISTRLKAVGIQKTNGARTQLIIKQLLSETIIFLLAGFLLAVFIYKLVELPLVRYLGFDIALTNTNQILIAVGVFGALLLFNLAANYLPVKLIAKKQILSLIKEVKPVRGRISANNYFIFFQFILSGLIILSSIIVQKQINYMVGKDRGYDSQNIMMLVMWEMNPATRQSFINELKAHDDVESVSTSDVYFGVDMSMNAAFFELQEDENYFHTSVLPVDDEFLNTFNFEMKEGRFFDKDKKTDFDAAVLNESALREYRGQGSMMDKDVIIDDKKHRVIGIVKDFNFRSLHHPIQPLVITRVENFGNVFIKIRNNNIPEVTKVVASLWRKYDLQIPLDYTFHNEVVAAHYKNDQQAKRLLLILSFLSITIACVGLYAISFFTIVRRTKEIGIRKVNGARVSEVVSMLNRDFLKWVAGAFIIACPIAWYFMNKWLQDFAFKTDLNWWIFGIAGGITITIAMLTVSFQAFKAATRNPVEALRYE
jgi:putative ABC transport system permease protein